MYFVSFLRTCYNTSLLFFCRLRYTGGILILAHSIDSTGYKSQTENSIGKPTRKRECQRRETANKTPTGKMTRAIYTRSAPCTRARRHAPNIDTPSAAKWTFISLIANFAIEFFYPLYAHIIDCTSFVNKLLFI